MDRLEGVTESEDKTVTIFAGLWVEDICKIEADRAKGEKITETHTCAMAEVAEPGFARQ